MVKNKEINGHSPKKTPKGKKPPLAKALTSLKPPKNPEKRRKSLASVLPTPKLQKRPKNVSKTSENIKIERTFFPLLKNVKQETESDRGVLKISELETKHQILVKDVKKAVEGVIKFASNNPKLQNQLFNSEIPLFLQINSFKIPNKVGKVKHVFRVPLEHSILTPESDVCLIVPDVKGIPNKELERHQEHYEKLLADKGVKNIKKIMSFYEFRSEYETFELKNRLADLYDVFLVDGRISGKVVHKGGQVFYKKRKVPNPIKLHVSKLADHIDTALKKVYFDMNHKSDSCIVQFGHSKMTTKQLIDNVYSVVQFLDNKFPGKMDNIRSLNVYTHRGSSVPIFVSLKNPNDIKVPTLKHQKPKDYKTYVGELTTQYNAEVVVRPSGKVMVKRRKNLKDEPTEENEDNTITDADILAASNQEKEVKKEQTNQKGRKRKNSENFVEVKTEKKDKKRKNTKNNVLVKLENGKQTKEVKQEQGSKKSKKRKYSENDVEVKLETVKIEGNNKKIRREKIKKEKVDVENENKKKTVKILKKQNVQKKISKVIKKKAKKLHKQ